jgi:hypothetical protein
MVYLREAGALTKEQVAAHGGVKTRLFGLAGGAATILIVVAAQAMDGQFIGRQLAALDSRSPQTWRAALRSLKAYPICGHHRCRQLVCRRLSWRFSPTRIPAQLAGAFKQAYGMTASDACGT